MTVEETPLDWMAAEKSRHSLRTELQRLKNRAKKRPVLLLLVTALLTGLVMTKRALRTPVYEGRVTLAVREGGVVDEQSPLAAEKLGEYFEDATFTTEALQTIIERYDLFPLRRIQGIQYAISEFREAMTLTLANNYFAMYEGFDDTRRSARIHIEFENKDPQKAFLVAQDLSNAIATTERDRRVRALTQLHNLAIANLEAAEGNANANAIAIAKTQEEIERLAPTQKGHVRVAHQVNLDRYTARDKELQALMSQLQSQEHEISVALAAERSDLGLHFQVVDTREPQPNPPKSIAEHALITIALFLCLMPLCAVAIAAFDSRVHDLDDLLRLDLPVLGHVPSFPGHNSGSLQQRSRRAKPPVTY